MRAGWSISDPVRADGRLCVASLGIVAAIGLIGGALTWTAYTIAALVEERRDDFSEECGCTSYLWAYTVVLLLWTWVMAAQVSGEGCMAILRGERRCWIVGEPVCHLVAEVGVLAWGWWEVARPEVVSRLDESAAYRVCRLGVGAHTVCTGVVLSSLAWSYCCSGKEGAGRSPVIEDRDIEGGLPTPTAEVVGAGTYTSLTEL